MSAFTQFDGTLGKEVCNVVVGFDFGTSCSKVVFRTPFHNNGRAFATPFGTIGHKSCRYLLPSVVWIDNDGRTSLKPMKDRLLLRDIKYHLMCDKPLPAVNRPPGAATHDPKGVAVAFLALALREARSWFLQQQQALYGQYDLRWMFNIGLPSADFADEQLCSTYDKVAKAAWALSIRTGEPRLEAAATLLDTPEQWNELDDSEGAEIHLIPEVAAEVAGYAKSSLRDEGLHMLVDIGATTLDVCSFVLHKAEGDDCYALLTADVQALGASILYQARVSAVLHTVNAHMGKLWDHYDPVSAMADDAEAYAPNHESVAEAIRHHDGQYALRCRRQVGQTIIDLKTKRDPRSSRWQSMMPLFLSGGGSVMPFYRSFIQELSNDVKKLYDPCQGIRRLDLTKPVNFDADLDQHTYHRFAVAWGLSYPKTDIGTVSRPSESPDVPPRDRHDWGGREFISKDMV